jgi:hypothetical protein
VSDLRKLAAQAMEYLAAWSVGESPDASAVNDLIADLDAALAQPGRKPLTERQIFEDLGFGAIDVQFVRIVEKAHGIGDLSNSGGGEV